MRQYYVSVRYHHPIFTGSSTSGVEKWQSYLTEKFEASFLEVGELMRSEVDKETPIGLALKSLMLKFAEIPDVSSNSEALYDYIMQASDCIILHFMLFITIVVTMPRFC